MTATAIAVVTRISTDRRGVTSCEVLCPFVSDQPGYRRPHRHVHGLPGGVVGRDEVRLSHCGSGGSYRIVDPAAAKAS